MSITRYDTAAALHESTDGFVVTYNDYLASLAAKDAEIKRLKRMLVELNAQKHVDSGLVHESDFGGDE